MANPGIEELQNNQAFELIAEVNHNQIKEFVIDQLSNNGKLVRLYMIYQVLMIVTGIFFLTRAIILAFQEYSEPLYYTLGAVIFCFSFLIIIHELMHGIAIKLTGAKNISYGAYFRKFIFYAEADQHVVNNREFAFIALTPLVAVKILTLAGLLVFLHQPVFYTFIFIMSAHSLFCAGDIGLLSIFYTNKGSEIFTYDVKAEKKSYYFKKLKSPK